MLVFDARVILSFDSVIGMMLLLLLLLLLLLFLEIH